MKKSLNEWSDQYCSILWKNTIFRLWMGGFYSVGHCFLTNPCYAINRFWNYSLRHRCNNKINRNNNKCSHSLQARTCSDKLQFVLSHRTALFFMQFPIHPLTHLRTIMYNPTQATELQAVRVLSTGATVCQ